MALRARLDHDRVYWGPEEVAELAADDIAAPDEAIRPGAYRWQLPKDGDVGHWVPLAPTQVKKAETAPSLEQAFYEFLRLGRESAHVQAWMRHFEGTVDGFGRDPK